LITKQECPVIAVTTLRQLESANAHWPCPADVLSASPSRSDAEVECRSVRGTATHVSCGVGAYIAAGESWQIVSAF
jgi:hypothetical protein